jgi:4-amino-4-deoxy-L-arabinose transferase-like glycosyltransferase
VSAPRDCWFGASASRGRHQGQFSHWTEGVLEDDFQLRCPCGGLHAIPVWRQPDTDRGLGRSGAAGRSSLEAMSASREHRPWPWLIAIAVPLLAGGFLRFHGLRSQLLVGDEQHVVDAALSLSIPEMLSRWTVGNSGADYSIPMGVWFRLLMDLGVHLSEIDLRAPALAAGLAAVVLVPRMARTEIGPKRAVLLAWLIALSPPLVLYSRIVRSYMPATLVATVAVLAFHRWYCSGDRRAAWAYVLLAPLAIYLHLVSAPFVLAPFVFAGVDLLVRKRGTHDALRVVALLAGVVAVTGLLLLPAVGSLAWVFQHRAGRTRPSPLALLHAFEHFAGTSSEILALLVLVAGAWGLRVIHRERPRFALYTLTIVATHGMSLLVFAPFGFNEPVILMRYLLVSLPIFLLWVAVGLGTPWPWRRQRIWRPALGTALAILILATSPLATTTFLRSSFSHYFLYYYGGLLDYYGGDLEARVVGAPVPEFYRTLDRDGASGAILEVPWHALFCLRPYADQLVHGQDVIGVIRPGSPLDDERLALRNIVPGRLDALIRSRGRYVVVHRDPVAAERAVPAIMPYHEKLLAESRPFVQQQQTFLRRFEATLRRRLGPPDVDDDAIAVWDLDRVRGRAASQPDPGASARQE